MSMMQIEAEERSILGKKSSRLLQEGKLPAVIYGNKYPSRPITLDAKVMHKVIEQAGKTSIIEVTIHGGDNKETKEPVLIWNVKRNPVKNNIEHIDLYRVNKQEKVKVRIPLTLVGVSKGVKLGGKLEVYREYIDIMAYPQDLIKEVTIDITDIDANQTVYIEDVIVPSTITKVYDSNISVLSVILNTAKE